MVRRYEEPIEVRASRAEGEADAPAQVTPDAFLWRGRLYVVHEVLDHWQERRAWWRDALEGGSFGGQADALGHALGHAVGPAVEPTPDASRAAGSGEPSGDDSDEAWGEGQPSHERQVWRVTASPGQTASLGVYDLGFDGGSGRWLLLRAQD